MPKRKNTQDSILDLDSLINDVVKSGIDPSYFDVDVDLPRASNIVEFATSSSYLNKFLFSKQAEQCIKLFCEWCPDCSDKDFVREIPVDASLETLRERIVLLDKNVCPNCGKNRRELFKEYPCELVSCLGQRSGKTALTGGIIIPYIMHRFLLLSNPARYYGVQSSTLFLITFVAVTVKQIEETLWMEFAGSLASSPWFAEYNKALVAEEKEKGLPKGTLVKVMNTYIWYGNKRLSASYMAADERALRGRTRVAAAIDELGWFNAQKDSKQANAHETYVALSNSLRTVRASADSLWRSGDYDTLPSYMLNISSPSSQYDKIMSLLKEGEVDTRKACFHWSTWEACPKYKRSDFAADEINSPLRFWRDFGAVPPLADSPFIANEKVIYTCRTDTDPLFKSQPKYVGDGVGDGKFIAASLVNCSTDKQTARIITCDAGEKGNHFCISVHHIQPAPSNNIKQIWLDGIIEVAPEHIIERNEIISIHFPTMFDIVVELCKHFNVLVVAYDRWQSSGEVQRLRDLKVEAEQYSPKWQDFIDFRNVVLSENYKMPRWERLNLNSLDLSNRLDVSRSPYLHAAVQMATVREIGRKVTKPEYGEDDIFRTSILASRYLLDQDWQKKFLVHGLGTLNRSQSCLGVVRGKSSAISGGYSGSGSQGTGIGTVGLKSSRR